MNDSPIGIFDSGLGGLTVARAVRAALPSERLVYLGDTARVPYGTRSPHTVLRYARSCARRLAAHDIKLLVVACNTVSAVALPMLRVELDVPVLGVIGPGARAGVRASRTHRLGVIATAGTVASGAYPRAVAAESTRAEVLQRPAPLLVPLVEEGWLDGQVPALVVRRYLEPLVAAGIDALVLGCTHYPLLSAVIEAEAEALAGRPVAVVDSAEATAHELATLLDERAMAAPEGPGSLSLMVTDLPARFREVAARFLGHDVEGLEVEAIDL
ncbi:MAG TPA: glutamate racemase [Sandaracinaceae bacterium LLY-WYZ-13_1]|nr:glutamate racemase [Sandaracinaceae bacterium LLY-WYZ-13_1]